MTRTWLMYAGENRIDYTQGGGLTDSLRGQTLAGSNETVDSGRMFQSARDSRADGNDAST